MVDQFQQEVDEVQDNVHIDAIEAPVAGLHDDDRLQQQQDGQRQIQQELDNQIAPVAELNDDARLQQQEDQQRQIQQELDHQVGLIDRAIVVPHPDNGREYISRV